MESGVRIDEFEHKIHEFERLHTEKVRYLGEA